MVKLVIIENSVDELIGSEHLLQSCIGLDVIARGSICTTTLDALVAHKPDLVLLSDDKRLERTVSLVRKLGDLGRIHILIVGHRDVELEILKLLEAGAVGYLERHLTPRYLEKAVRCVGAGEAWISRKLVALVLDRLCDRCGHLT